MRAALEAGGRLAIVVILAGAVLVLVTALARLASTDASQPAQPSCLTSWVQAGDRAALGCER